MGQARSSSAAGSPGSRPRCGWPTRARRSRSSKGARDWAAPRSRSGGASCRSTTASTCSCAAATAYRELLRRLDGERQRRPAAQAVTSRCSRRAAARHGCPGYRGVPAPLHLARGARRIRRAVARPNGSRAVARCAGVAPARSGRRGAGRRRRWVRSCAGTARTTRHRRAVGCRRTATLNLRPGRGVARPCGEGVPHRAARPRAGVRRRLRRRPAGRAALRGRGPGAGQGRRRGAARPPSVNGSSPSTPG